MGVSQRDEEIDKLKEEKKRLKEELKKTKKENQRYKKELKENSVIQRWKIGKFLHDNLAQQLTSAKISINLLKEEVVSENLQIACEDIIDIINDSIQEVRNLSHDIIPMDVEKGGSGEAFIYLKKRAERRHNINCELEAEKILKKINHREVATNLYHIAEEAIKNAAIHGEAKNIKITLTEEDDQLQLQIFDDGKGFDPANVKNGRGILIMRHRSEEMGGDFEILNSDEEEFSTCVSCSLPLKCLEKQ